MEVLHREAAIQVAVKPQHPLDLGRRRTAQRRRQATVLQTRQPRVAVPVPPAAEGAFADPKQLGCLHLAQLRPLRAAEHVRETHPAYPFVNACPLHANPQSWGPHDRTLHELPNPDKPRASHSGALDLLTPYPGKVTLDRPILNSLTTNSCDPQRPRRSQSTVGDQGVRLMADKTPHCYIP